MFERNADPPAGQQLRYQPTDAKARRRSPRLWSRYRSQLSTRRRTHEELVRRYQHDQKLTIGFGAVLLLTIALAISGWLSLSGVIHRSELMERIAALNEALDELRVARLQYMLDNGDAKSAEAVTEALDHFARSTGTSRRLS